MYDGCIEFFSFNDKAVSLYNFHARDKINLQTPCKRWFDHTTRADCCSPAVGLGPSEVIEMETETNLPRTGSQTCFALLSSSSPDMCPQWRPATTRELDTAKCSLIKSIPSSKSACCSTLVRKTAWSLTSAVRWMISHLLNLLCEFARFNVCCCFFFVFFFSTQDYYFAVTMEKGVVFIRSNLLESPATFNQKKFPVGVFIFTRSRHDFTF